MPALSKPTPRFDFTNVADLNRGIAAVIDDSSWHLLPRVLSTSSPRR